MALMTFKPTSPGRRSMVRVSTAGLHKGGPLQALTEKKPKTGGRNNNGRITTRHIGGGHKQAYRLIDFKRDKEGIPAQVERIEYDPNRTAHIALLCYADGERRYIIAPKGLSQGDQVDRRQGCADQGGQHLAAAQHADRFDRALHRDEAGQGRPDGPRRWRRCTADRP